MSGRPLPLHHFRALSVKTQNIPQEDRQVISGDVFASERRLAFS